MGDTAYLQTKLINLTMSRNTTIANRLREVLLNGHWIANTNYQQQLQNTHWRQATQQVGSLNTIAVNLYIL
jgi:hypothetical protein